MARYLVTGGAGFIGSNLVKKLLAEGQSIIVLDDLSTGRIENINPFLDRITFIHGSFTDLKVAQLAVKGVDFVLHQGAIASVQRSLEYPIVTNEVNIGGSLNMLFAARDEGVKRFVYATSSSVYGDSAIMPKREDMLPAPKSPYAIQKLTLEKYAQNFYSLFGLETVGLRYFNVFGPNQNPDSEYSAVIPIFIRQMLKGERPVIYGDGTTSRDFTYVDNNVLANMHACTAPDVAGEIINIACGTEISLTELVENINSILGTNLLPIFKDERIGDVKHSLADISKAKKLLNYRPVIDFDTGLQKTIEYYKTVLR